MNKQIHAITTTLFLLFFACKIFTSLLVYLMINIVHHTRFTDRKSWLFSNIDFATTKWFFHCQFFPCEMKYRNTHSHAHSYTLHSYTQYNVWRKNDPNLKIRRTKNRKKYILYTQYVLSWLPSWSWSLLVLLMMLLLILKHRNVINREYFYFKNHSLWFSFYKMSVIHTTHRFGLILLHSFCFARKEEEEHTHTEHGTAQKKMKRKLWNKYIPIARYAPKARSYHVMHTSAAAVVKHTYISQTQMPRRTFIYLRIYIHNTGQIEKESESGTTHNEIVQIGERMN